jgi:hypothetical protein
MSAVELLNYLIQTEEALMCGHDHTATDPSPCVITRLDPEDNNMGDEAFVSIDAYL